MILPLMRQVDRLLSRAHLLAFALLVGACGGADPAAVELDGPIDVGVAGDGDLALVLSELVEEYGQPAMAAMLIHDGAIVESAAVGVRAMGQPELVTIGDQWRIGSMTKAMTATLAAILVERGVIDWESTIGEVLTDVDSIHPEFADVRLEELLSHTSAMYRDGRYTLPSRSALMAWHLPGGPASGTRALIRGEFNYSNLGYIIAGTMLEVATGERWEAMIQREIFDPLGMEDSGLGAPDRADRLQPAGHEFTGAGWRLLEQELRWVAGPAGIVHTTMRDYSRWVIAHLEGAGGVPGLVSSEGFALLHDPKPGTVPLSGEGVTASGYGFGWFIADAADQERFGGETLWHTGTRSGWISGVWLVPDRDFAIAVFVNANTAGARTMRTEAVDAILTRHAAAFGG